MAENSISITAPEDNLIIFTPEGKPMVSSRDMALRFQKKHKHILEEIRRIQSMVPKDFYEPNFRPIEESILLPHSGGIRKDPAYLLTRDAFSLLAMGFTGKAAIQWKLKYIKAFNLLELQAIQGHMENVISAARQEGILAGRAEALATRHRDTPTYRALMRRALRYRGMGLELREIGKLMDCSHQKIFYMLKDAAILGLGV